MPWWAWLLLGMVCGGVLFYLWLAFYFARAATR